jgi:hypothetical protein
MIMGFSPSYLRATTDWSINFVLATAQFCLHTVLACSCFASVVDTTAILASTYRVRLFSLGCKGGHVE